jgi:hypothetical protein
MVWTGPYDAFHVYVDKEVASYDLYGSLPSSFIARTTMVGVTPDDSYPINDGRWEAVAIGAGGPAGAPGAPGPAGGAPSFFNSTVTGTLVTGEDWMAGTSSFASFYTTTLLQASRRYSFAFQQAAVLNNGMDGLAFIMASSRLCCTGHGTIYLPLKDEGGLCNYTNNNVHINVMAHGTLPVYINPLVDNYGTSPNVIVNTTSDGSGYAFAVLNPTPTNIAFSLFGAQQVVP